MCEETILKFSSQELNATFCGISRHFFLDNKNSRLQNIDATFGPQEGLELLFLY